MARVKVVFYLPLRDNDGRPLEAEINDVEMELNLAFAGWTLWSNVRGVYTKADGTRTLDVSGAYSIVMDESRIDEVVRILKEFRSKTLQESIYMEVQRNLDIRFVT
jgi:hypothetical protein